MLLWFWDAVVFLSVEKGMFVTREFSMAASVTYITFSLVLMFYEEN